MVSATPKSVVASCLALALVVATAPSYGAPASAKLTGIVYANDVMTPLAGATVVVTDAGGAKIESQPTRADGAFTIAPVTPGRTTIALTTHDGTYAIATPVTLAPGETRGVRLALKAQSKKDHNGGNGGVVWTGGAIAGMTAVIVGFVAAGVVAVDHSNNGTSSSASPSTPADK
jgi:Carboxypeptidase regulatory-like domain